jgi:predicted DNA-binding protein (MmcQ/YjbR family)
MAKKKSPTDAVLKQVRDFGLTYPGSHTKSPWPGHEDLAVNDKTFAYLSVEGQPFSISCKLPQSCQTALMLPFAKPTGYGLGKSGWVTAEFPPGQAPPAELLMEWIDESYRAQAPKKLVATLGAASSAPDASKRETGRATGPSEPRVARTPPKVPPKVPSKTPSRTQPRTQSKTRKPGQRPTKNRP